MCDKITKEGAERTSRAATRLARKELGAIALIVWLATPAFTRMVGDHTHPLTGSPDMHITQVRRLSDTVGGAAAEVEIRWTALVPRFTTIYGFEATLEVRYSDGSKNAVSSDLLKASDRMVILRVPARPKRGDGGILKEFKAGVTARFKSPSSLTLNREFKSAGRAGKADLTGLPSGGILPDLAITDARVTSRQCPEGRHCMDVKWTVSVPRRITIREFVVDIDVVQGDGSHVAAAKTVAGSARRVTLSVEDHSGSTILSFKVGLTTNFILSQSRTIVKEGAF